MVPQQGYRLLDFLPDDVMHLQSADHGVEVLMQQNPFFGKRMRQRLCRLTPLVDLE